MNDSHRHNINCKKPDTEEYTVYDSICSDLKIGKTNLVLEASVRLPFQGLGNDWKKAWAELLGVTDISIP